MPSAAGASVIFGTNPGRSPDRVLQNDHYLLMKGSVMKRSVTLFVVFLMFFSFISAFAQDEQPFVNPTYTQEFIEEQESMLNDLDSVFPRTLVNETYDQGLISDDIEHFDGFYFKSVKVNGRNEITITADTVSESEEYSRGWKLFNTTGSYQNFYFHIDVQLVEQDESNSGWVFFQYTNADIVGENHRSSGEICFPDRIDKYTTGPSGREYTTFYDLTEFENDHEPHTLEMIRLDGYTSVFIDGHFIAGFEDEFSGRFYHIYGVGLNPGGKFATYAFDNFIIRRQ